LDEAVRNLMQAATLPLDWLQAMPYAVISIDEFETAAGVTSAAGISAAVSFGICAIANFPFGSRQGIRIGHKLFGPDDPQLKSVETNIHDERSVADPLAGAYGVVNAVSLYVEHGQETFHSAHVEAAQRVAAQADRAGIERLVHVSGIGAAAASPSRYIRKRGEGELAVRVAFADALFVRPAAVFGPDDAFLTTILKLLRRLPIYPIFGRGRTRLQPAYVEDVAEAVARVMRRAEIHSIMFGGPRVYSYEQLVRAVAHRAGLAPPIDSDPVCRLPRTGMGLRNTPGSTPHA
jgi:uncharacterized protein YbjT (DUF2867 family)